MADRSTRYPADTGGSNVPLRSSSSSSRRPPRNTPLSHQAHAPPPQQQQHQHQQHQQHQQPQPSQRQHSQQMFGFNVDFDLVGPLGTGLSADVAGGAGGSDGRGHLGHSGGASAVGASGHSGGTGVKSAAVRSSPSFSAKQTDSTESKAEPRHVSTNNNAAHQHHHQYLPYAGNNSTAAAHTSHGSTRRIAAAETAPHREDYLFNNDLEAAMPYFVDFGGENDSSGGDSFVAGTGPGVAARIDSNSNTGGRLKRGTTSTGRSTASSVAPIPALDEGKQDSSLSMLDDFFSPTLMTSRPAAKTAPARDKQEQQSQSQSQSQHQHQHQPLQQSLQDSSLDFFSSLESTLPSNPTRSSARPSSSSSPFAQLASAAPLPSFPSLANDYSSLGRGNSHARTAPVRRPSQSNTSAYTSLESVPPSSAPLSPAYSGSGLNGTIDTGTSIAPSLTPANNQRRKNNLPLSSSPFSSAPFASTSPSVAGLSTGHIEHKPFSSAPSPLSDSMPAPSSPNTSSSGHDFSSYMDTMAFSAPAPPRVTPKPFARMPSHPQHSPRQPAPTAGVKTDPLFQTHRQTSHQSSSRRTVPAPASQPIKATIQAAPHNQNSYPTPSPPSPPPPPPPPPPPQAQMPTPPSLQMPPSPWLEDDDDFYHSPTLPSSTSAATPAATQVAPSPAPTPTIIPVPLPSPTPVPAQVVSPGPVSRESSRTPQPPHSKLPNALEEQKLQKQQQQSKQPKQPKQPKQQSTPPAKVRKQPPPPLSPKQETQIPQEKLNERQKSPPMSPAALSPALTKYPPPPPLILYSDDYITISSLHLTIHAFYFPLNTPLTIPLLSITDLETLPAAGSEDGNSGGMASWLKYKNWGVSALSDIWWARDPRQTTSTTASTVSGGNLLTSTLGAAAAAVTVAVPLSRYSNKENTAPLVHVVVRVEGEWLRKGFGVEHERGVKILKEAWKNVKESELGLRPLRPAMTSTDADGEDDLLVVERAGADNKHQTHDGNNSNTSHAGGSSEKRRWLTYQNTWTAYPFADDSPQFLAQQQRRGGITGAGGGVVGVIGATLASKAPRYRQQQRQRTGFAPQSTTTLTFGPDENCGDEPLFIDNDLNVHEEI
ncbi:hypothetical protein EC968_006821 [Mortierella alpina]|nr:hypothetical protein EC968_006821 [Mortierella alpina]